MGLEGAVRLGFRRELDAIADEGEREERIEQMVAAAHDHAKALNAATLFELDDVIDPAETRRVVAATLAAAGPTEPGGRSFVDTW
jgi:acetyl-CoA carboxylase carboxyltransferase component